MKPLLPGISEWSWFSEEKQIDFNGHFLHINDHRQSGYPFLAE